MRLVQKMKQWAKGISIKPLHAASEDPEIRSLSQNSKFLEILEQGRQQKAKGGLSPEEMEQWLEEESLKS